MWIYAGKWNLALQPLKTLYLYYHNGYGHLVWQGGDLPWETPICKMTQTFDHLVLRDHLTNWNHYISSNTMPMISKLCRVVTYHEGLAPIKSHDRLIRWSCEITWHIKSISTITLPMVTKLGRMVINNEKLQLIKWHDPSTTCSFEVTLQIKNTKSPLQCVWSPNVSYR